MVRYNGTINADYIYLLRCHQQYYLKFDLGGDCIEGYCVKGKSSLMVQFYQNLRVPVYGQASSRNLPECLLKPLPLRFPLIRCCFSFQKFLNFLQPMVRIRVRVRVRVRRTRVRVRVRVRVGVGIRVRG